MLQEIKMESRQFCPLKDYLLVKVDDVSNIEKTKSGLLVVNQKSITQRPCSGYVLAKGSDCTELTVGDYIVFPDTDGIDVKFLDSDGTREQPEFMLLRYKSVIGYKDNSESKNLVF